MRGDRSPEITLSSRENWVAQARQSLGDILKYGNLPGISTAARFFPVEIRVK